MTFHILTPFSRAQNWGELVINLLEAGLEADSGRGTWHPIFASFEDRPEKIFAEQHLNIVPHYIGRPPLDQDVCYWKLNEILGPAVDENCWYGFLPDDDTYERDFFTKLHYQHEENGRFTTKGIEPGVIVVSARRFETFDEGGSHWVLPACKENLRQCRIGLEQFFVRGSVLKHFRFANDRQADGALIEEMVKKGVSFGFAPELYVNWNKLR